MADTGAADPRAIEHEAMQAQAYLTREVFAPFFFEKLAKDYGFAPRDEEDAQRLLRMGMALVQAEAGERVKKASADSRFYADAEQHLAQAMQACGHPADLLLPGSGYAKEAAGKLAQVDTIVEAVLAHQRGLQQAVSAQPNGAAA